MPPKPGANYTGTQLEKFVEDRLIEKQYQFVQRKKFTETISAGQPVYSKQLHLGNSIYDTPMYGDFVLFHPVKWPNCLIIECKWQQVSGSVDEKFPYFVLNIQQRHPYQTVVLLDGDGYKKKAAEWMRKQVGNNLLSVLSMAEFHKWANRGNI